MLTLDLLVIERLVVHHINQRDADRNVVEPNYADDLLHLPPGAMDMFTRRIVQALGHRSHGIEVDIRDAGPGSFFQNAADAMHADEGQFMALSRQMAHDLAAAQVTRDLPPSKLIVVSGVVGRVQRRFMAVIKAEMQDGLGETRHGRQTQIDYLTNIFLTDSQRLYKIGYVQQIGGNAGRAQPYQREHFVMHLFDHLMTGTETRSAALYFYSGFMGADIAASDKRLTQDFYERTIEFINSRGFEPEDRMDLVDALRSELRSNKQTLSVADFGDEHFERATRDEYCDFMERANFPVHAVSKNTEYIKAKLKRRQRMVFSGDVVISTPPDKLKELVSIDTSVDGVTTVTINGTLQSQE
ncbi:nucleoid-associated protein [Burkholderia multivorans]|uniref:nucleoid-associated protein n=1 Tax=Burkholderia TaxID=32008 RepID=UPI000278072C|nr:nucleoid-associated protein [Burkholderia multivorans]AVR21427.1 nucleoid-associated protein NdpA [Burkholderia multivorans]EJO52938.1 nucleoid-associated protein NdpA [Burkholderia multivorans ATCC BAA-247]MBY4791137.1 nucleoid-associated protein [Burkholderia multivorans]MCO1434760.1 nucleoid-associated protein [Burkholderia multivorans]PRE61127.1 nucleoid-associated protein NdpA [Burkholderia multivorans]